MTCHGLWEGFQFKHYWNMNILSFLPSTHTPQNVIYLFSPFKDTIEEGNNTKKGKIQEISVHLTLTIIFRYYKGSFKTGQPNKRFLIVLFDSGKTTPEKKYRIY